MATLQYAKLIAFVIGHESSHMWIDDCSSVTSETRADDFGFMLSSLLLDEQMLHAVLYNAMTLTSQGFTRKLQSYRAVARQKIRDEIGADQSPDLKTCYKNWAGMSNGDLSLRTKALSAVAAKLYRTVLTEVPPQLLGPASKKGFELFTLVYEDIGTAEYLQGDATHPNLETRKLRLSDKYPPESQIVNKLYQQFIKHSVQVSEETATTRFGYVEALLEPVYPPGVCKAQIPKKPPSDDPCLSPPPDPEQMREFE